MATQTHTESQLDRGLLISGHMDMAKRLARKIARRVPPSVGCDELESAAFLGLTEAANRFDPSRGEPFVAYAAKRVRGAILDELRRADVLTRRGREGARRLADATHEVEARTGHVATADQVAEEMGVSLEMVAQYRARLQSPSLVSLDDIHDVPQALLSDAPDVQALLREQKVAVVRALEALSKRDLMVLSMYYQESLTLKEIGDLLGVSESRVCQIRTRALRMLRESVGN